jgi:hypothetical protein
VLIDLVLASEQENRPLYPRLIEEPTFFRLIKKWIIRAVEVNAKIAGDRERMWASSTGAKF